MEGAKGGVLGVYDAVDTAVETIEKLRAAGMRDITVFSPLPQHDLEHALHVEESPVRLFTLVGGLTGAAAGFAFGTWTSLDWPLVTGGKPIISLPAFVIIAFELTILFGALATVLGLFINARLPARNTEMLYDPSFSAGNFGILVTPGPERTAEARAIMEQAGASEIRVETEEVGVAR